MTTAKLLIERFDDDLSKYSFVVSNSHLLKSAKELIGKYWKNGLRTLDSIQLSSVLEVKSKVGLFLTSDNVLGEVATMEGLSVK